jgi:hypothetical protein
LQPEAEPIRNDGEEGERARTRLTIALLAAVAAIQIGGMLAMGDLSGILVHAVVFVPAAGFAIALSHGLRVRIGIVAFALLWSAYSIWGAVEVTRFAATLGATVPGIEVRPISPWFVRIVAARAIVFTAAVTVLVTGAPHRRRRLVGIVLGALFVALFLLELAYQRFGLR